MGKKSSLDANLVVYKDKTKYKDLELNELIKLLKRNKKGGIKILKEIFDIGFRLDGRVYYVNGRGLIGGHWSHDMSSVIDKGEAIPQIHAAMTNVLAEVQQAYDETKTNSNAWIGRIWSRKDDGEHGLYGATVPQITGYINNLSETVEYKFQLSELKAIATKLKGLLRALEMQHSMAMAMLYSSRRSSDIFQDAMGSMITRSSISDAIEEREDDMTNMEITDAEIIEEDEPKPKNRKRRRKKK